MQLDLLDNIFLKFIENGSNYKKFTDIQEEWLNGMEWDKLESLIIQLHGDGFLDSGETTYNPPLKGKGRTGFLKSEGLYMRNQKAIEFYNKVPNEHLLRPYSYYIEKRTQKENDEDELRNLDLLTKRRTDFDYDKIQCRAKWSFRISIAAIALSVLSLTLQWMCKKPG